MTDDEADAAPPDIPSKRLPYQGFIGACTRVVDWLGKALLGIAAGVLGILMLLTVVDVIMRYALDRPIAESYELTQVCLMLITFFGLAYVAVKKSHVRITVVSDHLPTNMQRVLRLIVDSMSFVLFVLLTWQAYEQIVVYYDAHQIFSNLRFPVYTVRILLFIGCIPFCLVLVRDLVAGFGALFQSSRRRFGLALGLSMVLSVTICFMPFWYAVTTFQMTPVRWSLIAVVLFFVLMFMGMTLASGLALVGFVGVGVLSGLDAGFNLLGQTPASVSMNYNYSVIPLFVLMGMFAYHSKIVAEFYHAAGRWVGHVPGGLGVASLAGCAGFAAVCGSSVASAAAMSNICYPELKKYNYRDSMATGTIAAGGTLGILIPPSMDFIIYGVLTLTSIGSLFIAGILPGILMVTMFMATCLILCRRKPELGPAMTEKFTLGQKVRVLPRVLPVVALFLLVIGGIYFGIFTPSEGASIGCFGALVIALVKRSMGWRQFYDSLRDTVETSSMLLIILIGAMMFGYFLALTGVPTKVAGVITSLDMNRWAILAMIMVVYLLLGCLMDAFSIMIITVPILFPAVMALGFDPIWYGVLMITTVELGLISPPFGMAAFVVAGTTRVPVGSVFRGVLPYVATQIGTVIILMFVPPITLFLPGLMAG